jgi:hypothetical protein
MTADSSELPGFTSIPEPDLMFANGGLDKHPLRRLIEYGPYGARYETPAVIRFALVAPTACRDARASLPRRAPSWLSSSLH